MIISTTPSTDIRYFKNRRLFFLYIIILSFYPVSEIYAEKDEFKESIFQDSCYVKSKDEWYILKADFRMPNSLPLWNAVSQQLFHRETISADSAYVKYIHSFVEMKDMKKFIQTQERLIELSVKCTSQVPGRYINITAKYFKQWNKKKMIYEIVKEKNFIYDVKNDKVLTIQDVFNSSKVNEIEAYAADSLTYYMIANNNRVLLVYTKKDKHGNSMGLPRKTETLQYNNNLKIFKDDFKMLIGYRSGGYANDVQEEIIYKKETSRILINTSIDYKVEIDERDMNSKLETGVANLNDVQSQIPQFNGGSKGLAAYIANNFKFPDEGWSKQSFGRLEVSFDVEPYGSISNIEVLRSIDEVVDNEAVRVISEMPNWTPGRQTGFSFIVKCTLRIEITPTSK